MRAVWIGAFVLVVAGPALVGSAQAGLTLCNDRAGKAGVGAPVLVTGGLLFFGDITAEAAVAALEPGDDPYAGTRAAMQGAWVSADDPQSRIEIFGSEQTDIYGGEVLRVSVLTLADWCDDVQGGVLLRVQLLGGDPADMQCYAVLTADGTRLELSYLGRGNTLVYLRP